MNALRALAVSQAVELNAQELKVLKVLEIVAAWALGHSFLNWFKST
ncbi:hypothetical protein G6L99_09145 [Agrobacterium rhizogenes]|nr:hypothetical protein [Rhizobium rhizogenes]NTH12275.1 hypothetical protein [Rhizobium rhizogenes]